LENIIKHYGAKAMPLKPNERQDYTYRKVTFSHREGEFWGVYIGRTILYSLCRSERHAQTMCELMNKSPYAFDRYNHEVGKVKSYTYVRT
jgi:hypothetical protein